MIKAFLMEREFGRFLVVGCANTVFALSIYYLLNLFMHYQLAYGLAYVAGIFFSYWLNTRWVFKTAPNWKSFFSFPFVYLFQFALNIVLLHLLVEVLHWSEWFSPLAVIALGIPVTFVLSRYVIKRPAKF